MALGWKITWRLVLALAALAAVLLKAGTAFSIIPPQPALEGWALVLAGITLFIESVSATVSSVRRPIQEQARRDADKAVLACLASISASNGVDLVSLGGSVFLARRRHWYSNQLHLKRFVRFRISDYPQPSQVKWMMGKGVIGEAWKFKKIIHMDWSPIAKRWGDTEFDQSRFDKMPSNTKSGFTYEEFRGIVAKYAEILAVPIWNANQTACVGVLAIDVPMTVEHAESGHCLKGLAVNEIASNGAKVLSNVIGKL